MEETPHDPDSEQDSHGPMKSFLDHLEDLRWLIIKVAAVVATSWVLAFAFGPKILLFLQYPIKRSGITEDPSKFLRAFNPMDAFSISLQLALYAGLIVAAPLIIYLIASYLLPAMTYKERRIIAPAFWLGSLFFLGGVAFCYFLILPPTLKFSQELANWLNITMDFWTIDSYVSFVTKFMLGMGIAFELPLVILILIRFGILDYPKLAKARRFVIVANLIIAAIITPTPDIFTQLVLAIPMTLMYEGCVWIAWLKHRRKSQELEVL
jgi:sec-independent protein translocase protein TatC